MVNQVGPGLAFGTDDNEAVVLAADGSATPVPRGPKEVLADVVWDLVAARLAGSQAGQAGRPCRRPSGLGPAQSGARGQEPG